MGKVIEVIREKIVLIGIIVGLLIFVVVLIGLTSGKGKNSYENLEKSMVTAAKKYYKERENRLPDENGEKVQVSLSALVDGKYIKEIKDPQDSDITCTGRVETTKSGSDYIYESYLNCGDNYFSRNLADELVQNTEKDENGNGLYQIGNDFIYKGDKVRNFVKFNNEIWRIMLIDSSKDIKLIKATSTEDDYIWDDRYNVDTEYDDGINDFNVSRVKDTLTDYYKTTFDASKKNKIVEKDFCVGKKTANTNFDGSEECSKLSKLKVGLMYISEYYRSSIDPTCKNFGEMQCSNYNYLHGDYSSTWTLTGAAEDSFSVYFIYYKVDKYEASETMGLRPVIYLSSDTVYTAGNGTEGKPFVVK